LSEPQAFRKELEAYLRGEAKPRFKYAHQLRLYALTQRIAADTVDAPAFDDDVVFAAAMLHDLGVFVGHRPEDPELLRAWDHVAYVRERGAGILVPMGFPEAKVAAVIACVEEHMPQCEPQSFEATLLRDADMLEQMGAVGILRTAAKLDSDTRFHLFSDVRRTLERTLETLPGQLKLEASRRLAEPRVALLRAFLDGLDAEVGEHLD